ncbi:MAG: ScpA family protein [Actinomycetaceae bacterium]|nr:ScpA family protein [Actinomycetaceae bacterium]
MDVQQSDSNYQYEAGEFILDLEEFSGPFDLLLSLISARKLDITVLSLADVTDEFIAHMRTYPDLSQTSEFLVVAATLLDMKAARLLPVDETDDEDLELLEARDVLFSRLLQYRAFKEASHHIRQALARNEGYVARNVEEPLAQIFTPQLVRHLSLQAFCFAAVQLLEPTRQDATFHLHDITYPVGPEAEHIMNALKKTPKLSFHQLIGDCADIHRNVSRFLAILVLYRDGYISIWQDNPQSELTIECEHDLHLSDNLNWEWDY